MSPPLVAKFFWQRGEEQVASTDNPLEDTTVLFTTNAQDKNGMLALEILGRHNYQTRILRDGEQTLPGSIALFSPLHKDFQGSRGRFLRCSAVKLGNDLTPEWARPSKQRVAVIRTERPKEREFYAGRSSRAYMGMRGTLENAVLNMADRYAAWLKENSGILVPWFTSPNDPRAAHGSTVMENIRSWLEEDSVREFRQVFMIKKSVDASDVQTVKIAGWDVNFSDQRKVFPAAAAEQAIAMLSRWSECFPREETWVQKSLGLPSFLVRFDCIVQNGKLVVYEIEERPAGIGISSLVNPEFGSNFSEIARTWSPFRVEVSPLRRATDDPLWIKNLSWEGEKTDLVLVRAEPEEQNFHRFEPHSVSTLKAKGDKSYGEGLGLWRRVSNVGELDWDKCFVLKPLQGSKLRDLEIWDPTHRPGSSPRGRVESVLSQNEAMFCQRFFDPMESGMKRFPWMIYRVFFAYNCSTKSWHCLGGNWNARHNLRIHGASDAVFGPAVVE